MPALNSEHRENLDRPITAEEILLAIKSLKLRTHPGPDGQSATYYKKFSDLLSPLLVDAYNALLDGHSFRTESLTAAKSDTQTSPLMTLPGLTLDPFRSST